MGQSITPRASAQCPYIPVAPPWHQMGHPDQRVSPGETQPWRRFPARWTEAFLLLQQQNPRQNITLLQTRVQRKPTEPYMSLLRVHRGLS